jgi:hypothetical protein
MDRRCFCCSSIGLALLWGASGSSVVRGQSKPSFEAGAARRIITPDPLLPVSGGMGIPSPAKSKQGELTARAMVFRAGGETVAVVSVDLLGFPSVLGDRARALVPRLAPASILIGATHTHSAPDCYAYPDSSSTLCDSKSL